MTCHIQFGRIQLWRSLCSEAPTLNPCISRAPNILKKQYQELQNWLPEKHSASTLTTFGSPHSIGGPLLGEVYHPHTFLSSLKRGGPADFELQEAASRMADVTGISPDLERMFLSFQVEPLPIKKRFQDEVAKLKTRHCGWEFDQKKTDLLTWNGVVKGRDLFVKGMPRFQIPEVMDALIGSSGNNGGSQMLLFIPGVGPITQNELVTAGVDDLPSCARLTGTHEVEALQAEISSRITVRKLQGIVKGAQMLLAEKYIDPLQWIFRVSMVQAYGHFPALRKDARTLKRVAHILENPEESSSRQHLIQYAHWWNCPENAMRLDELEDEQNFTQEDAKLPPKILLSIISENVMKARVGPDVSYEHLREFQDSPCDQNGHFFRVLRSSYEVHRVADQLCNCASSYESRVQSGKYILIGLFDAKNKALALAGYSGGGTWDHRPVAAYNGAPSTDIQKAYECYLPNLERKWQSIERKNIFEAVKQDGCALKYASTEIKADKEVVLEAVKQDGRALEYASTEIKADKEVVLEAVKQDGSALYFVSDELKADKEVLRMVNDIHATCKSCFERFEIRKSELRRIIEKKWQLPKRCRPCRKRRQILR